MVVTQLIPGSLSVAAEKQLIPGNLSVIMTVMDGTKINRCPKKRKD